MPKKVRELIADLEAAGFEDRGGTRDDFWQIRRRRQARAGREESDRGVQFMNDAGKYVKIVAWSEEDRCFVGSCPGLLYGGCHGDDEQAVFAELRQIVEETVQLYQREKKPLPPPTSVYDWANTITGTTK